MNERVHSEPDFRNSPRASTPYMLYFPTMSKENVSLECRPITAFCPLLAGVLRIYLDNYGIMLTDAATVTIPTYLRDRDTRFDLAKSGIIGKILMNRAHGRPLKIF